MANPDPTFPITLALSEWNAVLGALGQMPYHVAAPLIARMTQQAQLALAQPGTATNGASHDHIEPLQ